MSNSEPTKKGTGFSARSFSGEVLFAFVLTFVGKLKGFITIPLLTKYLGAESYGIWVQIYGTLSLVSPIITLHLHQALLRFIVGLTDRQKIARIYFTITVFSLLSSLLGLSILFYLSPAISIFFFRQPQLEGLLKTSFLLIPLFTLTRINLSYLRGLGKIKASYLINTALSFLEVLLLFTTLFLGGGLQRIIGSFVVMYSLFGFISTATILKAIGLSPSFFENLTIYLRYSIPLIPALFSDWVMSLSDRYFVGYYSGAKAVGIYSSAYSLCNSILLFATPFEYVLIFFCSQLWEDRDYEKFRRLIQRSLQFYFLLALPVSMIFALLGRPLLSFLANKEVAELGWRLNLPIVLGTLLWGATRIILQIALASKNSPLVAQVNLLAAASNLLLNFLLIPRIGYWGAAVSTLATYLFAYIYAWYKCGKIIPISLRFSHLAKIFLASLLAVWFLTWNVPHPFLKVVFVFVSILVYLGALIGLKVLNREELKVLRSLWG